MAFGTLDITQATGQRSAFLLDKLTVRIGRGDDNDLVLNDNRASRNHAEILCDPDGLKILDLGSANGTYVDGARLLSQFPQALAEGSVIQIGGSRMRVSLAAKAVPVTAPGPGATQVDSPAFNLLDTLLSAPVNGAPSPAPARPPAGPKPPPQAAPPAALHLALTPPEQSVATGDAVSYTVSVTNRSDIVDGATLEVGGVPREWVQVSPQEVRLYPKERGEFQVTIQPPASSRSTAGDYTLSFTARSLQRPDVRVKGSAVLTVEPFYRDRIDLDPQQQSGWLSAGYIVTVANEGNAVQDYALAGRNDENTMRFRFDPYTLRLEPEQTRQVRLRAGVRLWRIVGKPRTFQFQLNVTPKHGSEQPLAAQGRFVQDPPIPPWVIPVLLGLLIFACGVGGFLIWWNAQARASENDEVKSLEEMIGEMTIGQGQTATAIGVQQQQTVDALGVQQQQTVDALGVAQQQTVAALSAAQEQEINARLAEFNQQATAAAMGNAGTQTAFALGVGPTMTTYAMGVAPTLTALANSSLQTQTAVGLTFAQTQTAIGLTFAQTQTAISQTFVQTQTVIAGNFNATSTAIAQSAGQTSTSLAITAAVINERTSTAIAFANQTSTAAAIGNTGTQTAAALRAAQEQTAAAAGNSQTQTAVALAFAQTQTAVSIGQTQTALAAPSPTPTATPRAFDRAVVLQPGGSPRYPGRTELTGNEFVADADTTLCMYDAEPTPSPEPIFEAAPAQVGGLTLRASSGPTQVQVGQNVTFTASLTSVEPNVYASGRVTLNASPGMTLLSASAGGQVCTVNGGSASCSLSSFSPEVGITALAQAQTPGEMFLSVAAELAPPAPYPVSATASAPAARLEVRARAVIAQQAPTPIAGLPNCGLDRLVNSAPEVSARARLDALPYQVRPVFYPPAATDGRSPFAIITADRASNDFRNQAFALLNFQRNVADVKVSIYHPVPTESQYLLIAFDEAGLEVGRFQTQALNVPARYDLTIRSLERPIRQVMLIEQFEGTSPLFITGVEIRYTDSLIRP